MKRIVLVLFFVLTVVAKAQSSMQGQNSAQERLALGYWIDPSTGLMWTVKDNGNDISWGQCSEILPEPEIGQILRLEATVDR